MRDVIRAYHDLLSDEQLAADSQGMMDDLLGRQGLVFGGRPLCTVLRPRLTNHARHAWLQRRVRLLMRVFGKAYDAAIASPEFRRQFLLAEQPERMRVPGVSEDAEVGAESRTLRALFVVGCQ
jgi:hypothetical protein